MAVRDRLVPAYLIHWNAPDWCASSARSLLESKGVQLDLTVVDNGQDAGSPLEELLPPGVRVLRTTRNLGYTGGANLALDDWRRRVPQSDLCLIGSHDLHVRSDTLKRLVEAATAHKEHGVLGPALLSPFQSSGGYWTGWRGGQFSLDGVLGFVERDWLSGTCMLFRRECVDSVGGFDEAFGSYTEDVDICLRAKDSGWRIGVVTDAIAWSLGSISRGAVSAMLTNRVLLVGKRSGLLFGIMRGAVDLGLLGLKALSALAGAWAFWSSPRNREEHKTSWDIHARELRRIYPILRYSLKGRSARLENSPKQYSEMVVAAQIGDGSGRIAEPPHRNGPVASVVITTRDGPESAARAVENALSQTIRNIEVVLVDGSGQPHQPSRLDKRLRIIRLERPLEIGAARNRGLAAAKGHWITFLDESDELVPQMLEASLRAAETSTLPSPVSVLSAMEVVDNTGQVVELRGPVTLSRGKLLPFEDGSRDLRSTNTLVAPAEVLRTIGGWDEEMLPSVQDELLLRLVQVSSIQATQQLTYRMKTRDKAGVSPNHLGRAEGIARTLAKHREVLGTNRPARARLLAEMGRSYLKAGRWLDAVTAVTRSLWVDPRRPGALRQLIGSLVGPRIWFWYYRRRRIPPAAQ